MIGYHNYDIYTVQRLYTVYIKQSIVVHYVSYIPIHVDIVSVKHTLYACCVCVCVREREGEGEGREGGRELAYIHYHTFHTYCMYYTFPNLLIHTHTQHHVHNTTIGARREI